MDTDGSDKALLLNDKRLDHDQIILNHELVVGDAATIRIMDSVPIPSLLLTVTRQIIYANESFRTMADSDVLGLRPGDAIGCRHRDEGQDGCGTGASCRFCNAVSIVKECLTAGERRKGEAAIVVEADGAQNTIDLKISAEPFELFEKNYCLVFMENITMEKHKEIMEKSFFHDVLGTAAGVLNLATYIGENTKLERELGSSLIDQSRRLIEEIKNQKILASAESGTLKINRSPFDSILLYAEAKAQAEGLREYNNQKIIIAMPEESQVLETDPVLVRRVLVNLLKNALEASDAKDDIRFSLKHLQDGVMFTVANDAVMSPESRAKVFQRGYSTKGRGRGLGTFGSKTIIERYLGGQISFNSEEGSGTSFSIILPYHQ